MTVASLPAALIPPTPTWPPWLLAEDCVPKGERDALAPMTGGKHEKHAPPA
jgi:hypothetical protein